jgi:hypothetical protein
MGGAVGVDVRYNAKYLQILSTNMTCNVVYVLFTRNMYDT